MSEWYFLLYQWLSPWDLEVASVCGPPNMLLHKGDILSLIDHSVLEQLFFYLINK